MIAYYDIVKKFLELVEILYLPDGDTFVFCIDSNKTLLMSNQCMSCLFHYEKNFCIKYRVASFLTKRRTYE